MTRAGLGVGPGYSGSSEDDGEASVARGGRAAAGTVTGSRTGEVGRATCLTSTAGVEASVSPKGAANGTLSPAALNRLV